MPLERPEERPGRGLVGADPSSWFVPTGIGLSGGERSVERRFPPWEDNDLERALTRLRPGQVTVKSPHPVPPDALLPCRAGIWEMLLAWAGALTGQVQKLSWLLGYQRGLGHMLPWGCRGSW